jgi:hypothetical protein
MRLKDLSGQSGRNSLPIEAKVRALKLWKIDQFDSNKIFEDLENTFGITIAHNNWKYPETFLENIERNVIKLLGQETNVRRSHLVKLLRQAGLIGKIET